MIIEPLNLSLAFFKKVSNITRDTEFESNVILVLKDQAILDYLNKMLQINNSIR
jgi:hypothetical protein